MDWEATKVGGYFYILWFSKFENITCFKPWESWSFVQKEWEGGEVEGSLLSSHPRSNDGTAY